MVDQAALGALFGFGLLSLLALVAILYVPLAFYLRALQRCIDALQPQFRPNVPSSLVWLALVPGIGLMVILVAIVLLATGLKNEGRWRQTAIFDDGGLAIGLTAVVLGLLAMLPLIGPLLLLVSLACWIVHWSKVSGFRRLLAELEAPIPTPAPSAAMNIAPVAAPAPVAPNPSAVGRTGIAVAPEDARLVALIGPLQGMTFPVGTGVILGRSPEAHIVIPDKQVSNRHAWIGPANGRLTLRDLQSTNGTYLNDNLAAPVGETDVGDGDVVALGKHGQAKFRVNLA